MPSGALARNRSRCSTPNRCCSSTTTMPRLLELDGVLQQRVRADDDARLAGGDLVAHLASSAALTSIRSAAPPGSRCRRRRADRPSPTGRARRGSTGHVGRQALPSAPAARTGSPRRPSAAWPAPRRWSCPSRPRPAASGSSAGWSASSVDKRFEHFALAGGQLERQPLHQRGEQSVVRPRRRAGPTRRARCSGAPPAPTAARRPRRTSGARWRVPGRLRSRRDGYARSASSSDIRSCSRTNDSGSGSPDTGSSTSRTWRTQA